MTITKITIGKKRSSYRCQGESFLVNAGQISEDFLYKEQKFARLYRAEDKILKVCFVQSWPKDYMRKYAGRSQADREATSADILAGLGLSTPHVFFTAISLSPWNHIESLHEMSFLPHHEMLNKHISQRCNSPVIVRNIAQDLATITNNMIFLKDFGLGNILCNEDGHVVWIDNDIKKFADKKKLACFAMRLMRPRLLNYLDSADEAIFWEVLSERAHSYNELLCEFKTGLPSYE